MTSKIEADSSSAVAEIQPAKAAINQKQAHTSAEILDWLVSKFAEVIGLRPEEIAIGEPTAIYGLGSVQLLSVVGELEDWLDRQLPGTLLWDFPTLREVAVAIAEGGDLSPSA